MAVLGGAALSGHGNSAVLFVVLFVMGNAVLFRTHAVQTTPKNRR